jgi:hypothetical protein
MFKIAVFEQLGSGEKKIQGIKRHGVGLDNIQRFDIRENLPELVDNPEDFITGDFSADLVLDYLTHPDLSDYLAMVCKRKHIPVIASGRKHADSMTPFT